MYQPLSCPLSSALPFLGGGTGMGGANCAGEGRPGLPSRLVADACVHMHIDPPPHRSGILCAHRHTHVRPTHASRGCVKSIYFYMYNI